MAYDIALIGLVTMGALVVVHKTDSSNQIVQPFVDAAEVAWEYFVDNAATKVKHSGRMIIRLTGDAFELGIRLSGAAIWAGVVSGGRLIEQGTSFVSAILRKYVPIIAAGMRRGAIQAGTLIVAQASKTAEVAKVYWPIVVELARRNARIAGKTAWSMLIKAGSGVKKLYKYRTTT